MKSSTQTNAANPEPLDRVIPPAEAAVLLGLGSRVTYWRWRQAGKLPPAIVVDGKCMGHLLSDIQLWIAEHKVV